MYLVHRGTLKVQRGGHTLAEVSDGGIIGELAVLTPDVRSADVVAVDHAHVLGVRRRAVEELMSKYPSFARSIVVELVRRLRSGASS
jgi:CRP-like cAMP-binding protein